MEEFIMKKALFAILALSLVFALVGCKSEAEPQQNDPNVPEWVYNPPTDSDIIYGVGTAKLSSTNQSMTFAEARARQSISRQLQESVTGMITDYSRDAGTVNDTTANLFAEQINRQLTDQTLVGAIPVKREVTKDGAWWVMVQMSKKDAAAAAAKAAKDVVDSEAARYAEFKAMEAEKLMDSYLGKNPTTPVVVSE
jgi:uncharacterized lipoprotein NlpE involved in copper resistance